MWRPSFESKDENQRSQEKYATQRHFSTASPTVVIPTSVKVPSWNCSYRQISKAKSVSVVLPISRFSKKANMEVRRTGRLCLWRCVRPTTTSGLRVQVASMQPRLHGVCQVDAPTVASEKDDQMSETIIKNRNLPNPHLFEPFFCTRACHHLSSQLIYRRRLFLKLFEAYVISYFS